MNMAKKKTGALICIQQDVDLTVYEHTGEMFNADVNARLIENIFFKNSPLHDGAMIIADNRIKAAGCILPVAQNANLPNRSERYGRGFATNPVRGEGSNKLLLNVLKLIGLHVNLLLILQTLYCILPTFVPDYCDI